MDGLAWLLVGAAALALAAGGCLLLMRWQKDAAAEPFLHFRCPDCKRRLRFRASQSAHAGQCSRCGCKLTFPPASQATD
jgi:hypothetical protein